MTLVTLIVIIMISSGPVFGDFRSGDRSDRSANESAGFVTDEGTRAGPERSADKSTSFSRRAGSKGSSRDEPHRDEC